MTVLLWILLLAVTVAVAVPIAVAVAAVANRRPFRREFRETMERLSATLAFSGGGTVYVPRGERPLSLEEFASLPWPSPEQLEAFVAHVCDAHSWYKHLSPRTGAPFVFCLAADAGAGFTADNPRSHHTWGTTAEYRGRFGFLDFCGDKGGRDAGPSLLLPPEVVAVARVVLYPYVSRVGVAPGACLWSTRARGDVGHLLAHGAQSAADADVLRWYASQSRMTDSFAGLSPEDREQRRAVEASGADPASLPPAVAEAIRAERDAVAVYAALQAREEAKIRGALAGLRGLHERLRAGGRRGSAGHTRTVRVITDLASPFLPER